MRFSHKKLIEVFDEVFDEVIDEVFDEIPAK